MKIESSAFAQGAAIPARYARKGDNVSPPLSVSAVPKEARSLVMIMDDPDAPHGLFTHWVVFNISPVAWFPEGEPPKGAKQGKNSWGETAYGGPQPPDREHRYFFRLFALNRLLDLKEGASREEVEAAMRGNVIAEAEWMGRFAPGKVEPTSTSKVMP
jgi:Raf kinase inhibitor-like YbhB/YbcL family protein